MSLSISAIETMLDKLVPIVGYNRLCAGFTLDALEPDNVVELLYNIHVLDVGKA